MSRGPDAEVFHPYVCDSCGHEGRYDVSRAVDEVQCPACGEPVIPLA